MSDIIVTGGTEQELIRKYSRKIDSDKHTIATVNADGVNTTSVTVPDQDLSVAPLDFTTSETENFKVDYIYIDFQTPVTETVTVWRTTSGDDELLETVNLISNQRVRLVANQNVIINVDDGEQLNIQCTDNGGVGTAKTTLKIEGV